jgi:hypothetical protein
MPSCSAPRNYDSTTNGIAMKKIMIVPCAEKIWSKCSGGRYSAHAGGNRPRAHHDRVTEAAQHHDERQR